MSLDHSELPHQTDREGRALPAASAGAVFPSSVLTSLAIFMLELI